MCRERWLSQELDSKALIRSDTYGFWHGASILSFSASGRYGYWQAVTHSLLLGAPRQQLGPEHQLHMVAPTTGLPESHSAQVHSPGVKAKACSMVGGSEDTGLV